jgi:hypothetical protein
MSLNPDNALGRGFYYELSGDNLRVFHENTPDDHCAGQHEAIEQFHRCLDKLDLRAIDYQHSGGTVTAKVEKRPNTFRDFIEHGKRDDLILLLKDCFQCEEVDVDQDDYNGWIGHWMTKEDHEKFDEYFTELFFNHYNDRNGTWTGGPLA